MFNKKLSKNASAVVTGAGSGIGKSFALELAKRGGQVICSDINLASAQQTADEALKLGGQAIAIECDVTKLKNVEKLAETAQQWLEKPIDLVINNAGVGIGGMPIGDIPMKDWQWAIDINMWGVIYGCHVFTPLLRQQGRGGIINVCSTASFAAAPLMGPYNVTKAAVLALSETLSAELADTQISVTALCPTFVKTRIVDDGRITGNRSQLAKVLLDRTGVTAQSVAKTTLNALDRKQLYVLPQLDARFIWRFKRLAPISYHKGTRLLGRVAANKPA